MGPAQAWYLTQLWIEWGTLWPLCSELGGGEGGGDNANTYLTSVQKSKQESRGETSQRLVKEELAWGWGGRGSPCGRERKCLDQG